MPWRTNPATGEREQVFERRADAEYEQPNVPPSHPNCRSTNMGADRTMTIHERQVREMREARSHAGSTQRIRGANNRVFLQNFSPSFAEALVRIISRWEISTQDLARQDGRFIIGYELGRSLMTNNFSVRFYDERGFRFRMVEITELEISQMLHDRSNSQPLQETAPPPTVVISSEPTLDDEQILSRIEEYRCAVSATGSRFTCDPPVMTTDTDYLVEASNGSHGRLTLFLLQQNFIRATADEYGERGRAEFVSWRRGTLNLIVSTRADWCEKWRLATALCKRLNLLVKEDRIAVFRAFLYNEEYGENYRLMTLAQAEASVLQ